MALSGMLAACTDLSDIEKKMESLESRVTALETVVESLNGNIEGLQALISGTTVNSATEQDGVWTLVLSNGETIELTSGSIGVGNAPVMSVDNDGYWMADYGSGSEYILKNGEKVKAVGTDGITPLFGVDENGFWTVSYDNGVTYVQVVNTEGQPVSALPSEDREDPYFADVRLESGKFIVTLRSGEVINVPVVPDFLCSIVSEGAQIFNYGETKAYNVTMEGVGSTMLTAPSGWSATLSESILKVTAPAAAVKSTLADSRSDVCILAFSAQGNHAAIAKVQVQLTDVPVVITPVASVTAGEAAETSLTFSVATSDATSWKYILAKEGETAPEAAKIVADGTEGSGNSVTITGLLPESTYILYVLPINGDTVGTIATASNTTLEKTIESYHALYEAGEVITINGKAYSKAVNGEATLLSADGEISTNGVYFIAENVTATYTGTGAIANLVVIGDKPGVRSTFKGSADSYIKLNSKGEGTGCLIFHNINIDYSSGTNYFATVNYDEKFAEVTFEDCAIIFHATKQLFYIGNSSRSIDKFTMKDCDINVTSATPSLIAVGSSTAAYGTYTVTNCVFYSTAEGLTNFKFHQGNSASYQCVVFTDNTLVDIITNGSYFNTCSIGTATVTGNIFHIGETMTKNHNVLQTAGENRITGGAISGNISFTNQEYNFLSIYGGRDNWFEGVEEIAILGTDPFAGGTFDKTTGIFIPAAEYAGYGAKR